jgi:hypothetical protein
MVDKTTLKKFRKVANDAIEQPERCISPWSTLVDEGEILNLVGSAGAFAATKHGGAV